MTAEQGIAVDFDVQVKLALYRAIAERGHPAPPAELAAQLGTSVADLKEAFARLASVRLLVLERDGLTIRMAPPFSGVPTQHRVRVGSVEYFANCAWDALGIPAALQQPGEVLSRCEQSREPLHLRVGPDGPEPSSWLFHCQVPAAQWWKDIVFT